MSFRDIDEEAINKVESFVREELVTIFKENAENRGTCFQEEDKCHFFGLFEHQTPLFKFMSGERKLIKRLVEHLKATVEEDPYHFTAVRHNISPRDTIELSVGLFFGTKRKSANAQRDMKGDLFRQLKILCTSFSQSNKLEPVRPISEDIVSSIINMGGRVRAEVICVFCRQNTITNRKPKTYSIPSFVSGKSASLYWTLSNFKKHLEKHVNGKQKHKSSTESSDEDVISTNGELSLLQTANGEESTSDGSPENTMHGSLNPVEASKLESFTIEQVIVDCLLDETKVYEQVSSQLLKMTKSALMNGDKTEDMTFNIENEAKPITVTIIPGDGSCLFSSFHHQLEATKINPIELKASAADLRKRVVAQIAQDPEHYKFALKTRVYEHLEEIGEDHKSARMTEAAMSMECNFFLKFCLPKYSCWGGNESILALSELHKVNVLVFSENGPAYFPVGFRPEYENTLCLAYRLANGAANQKRIHYDSVSGIEPDVLFECIKAISSRYALQNEIVMVDTSLTV